MDWKSVTISDGAGRFHIELSETDSWSSYYKTINRLRTLFESPQFQQYISGYYVNSLHDPKNGPRILRLVYLTPLYSRERAEQEIETFIQKNGWVETKHPNWLRRPPDPDTLAAGYGGPQLELEFRQFLTLETLIGLDLMKANLEHAQSLLATFRWQVIRSNLNAASASRHLEPTFQRDSGTFSSLAPEVKNLIWSGVSKPSWAHFLVNLVLGFDETNYSFGKPYPIKRINKEILEPRNAPFRISKNWKPQVV